MTLSEAQLQKRAGGIGSSEIAAILGENPFCGPHDVWLEKRGLRDRDEEDGRTWLGHVIEPALAAWYAEELGRKVRRFGRTVRHPKYEYALATPDYEVNADHESRHLLECKSVGWRVEHHWNRGEADGVPLYVLLQAQWQMGIVGAERCDVAVIFLSDGERLIYELKFDADLFAKMVVLAGKFWALVEAAEPPPVDGSDAAREVLRSVYGRNRAPLKPATPEAEGLMEKRLAVDEAIKAAEAEKALITNRLCALVGEADGIEGQVGSFTWKQTKAGHRVARMWPSKAARERAA